jgi:Mg-chelatase subunit ChlD
MGCDCAGPERNGVCDVPSPPATCGRACSASEPCGPGFYCGDDGTCSADCSASIPCADGMTCTVANGTCSMRPDGSVVDVMPLDVLPTDNTCAAVDLDAERVTPNVLVIVDRSGSMGDEEFPEGSGTSRWDAVRDALTDTPDGLIFSLQSAIRFGFVTYSGAGACPNLDTVACSLDNYDAIDTAYRGLAPEGDTPTGDSISAVLGMLGTLVPTADDGDPTIFILATDGEPDTCEDGDDEVGGRRESVEATEAAFDMGISTYVISVGDDVGADHLQDVANAGLGRSGSDPDAPFFVATDVAALNEALETIVGGVVDCRLTLSGTIDPDLACSGEVRLDGTVLPCDDPNGWRAIDATTIELTGTACDDLQGGATLTARFPCEVIVF